MELDQPAAAILDELEKFRRLPPYIADECRLYLVRLFTDAGEHALEMDGKIRGTPAFHALQSCFHAAKLVVDHGLQQCRLAGEMCVERLLAHAQFPRKVIHRHAAKPVRQEMMARPCDDQMRGTGGGGKRR